MWCVRVCVCEAKFTGEDASGAAVPDDGVCNACRNFDSCMEELFPFQLFTPQLSSADLTDF